MVKPSRLGVQNFGVNFEKRGYEFLRLLSVDCVSVGAQASHSGGSPISQRECAGSNWPPLGIPAAEPISITPEAVNRAGPNPGHGVNPDQVTTSTVLRLLSVLPAALFPFCAGVPAIGVGQPVRHPTAAKSGPWLRIASRIPPSVDLTPLFARLAVGVGQPQRYACRGS